MSKPRKVCRVDGWEFQFVGSKGTVPYVRIGNPSAPAHEEYIGSVDRVANIRKLRDFLTRMLKDFKP